ncbi:ATPase-AAA-core domain-containing protein [Mycena venus]|uniref:ATPase-AAA-core domain-containing protein n=1 Tax=Mycena venus TaxID=2733690 RepID=A0A8H7D5V9_9AGAR|nr:ATPase-AAA-core domain-containing protein [Mycena venus]
MPTQPTDMQIRLKALTTCFAIMADTLEVLANSLNAAFLVAIANTTRSLLKNIETVKKNKNNSIGLMEQTYELLNAIIILHIDSDTGGILPPSVLNHIGKFTEQVLVKDSKLKLTTCSRTLHKIYTFVESQQSGSKVKQFLRQGEMNTLLKDCKNGLAQGFEFFQLKNTGLIADISKMQAEAEQRHQEVLGMINGLSDTTSSDRASMIGRAYSLSHNSSKSISTLPSEPKIFHGRESELSDILKLLSGEVPRIAILGTGGMGKTSLARAVLHHVEVSAQYTHHRYFVACDSATNKVELTALIGAHLGLKPSKDLTQAVLNFLVTVSPSLLILDNLETVWEPTELRSDIEAFLSLLTDIKDLALIITMRGAERPAKVQWSHPFLLPLQPLKLYAAQQTFIDIAEDHHKPEDIDQILSLTDNMPLAINLIAHLVDVEGCSSVLSRWEAERTSP